MTNEKELDYDIAYIISHGFAARMVIQTDLLGKLASKGLNIALIAPDKTDENLKAYCIKNKIGLFEFNESGKFRSKHYLFKRKYFLEDLESNKALMEKHMYSLWISNSLNPIIRIRAAYYYLIYKLIKWMPSLRRRFQQREKRYLESDQAEELISQIRPRKLVATYPANFNEAALLHYGNKRDTTETWIHLLSWDNITTKGYFPSLADKYIAWGPIMKEELIEKYSVQEKRIHICGVPHFDIHFQVKEGKGHFEFMDEIGLNRNNPYIFFAMSSPRFAPREIDIVEWLANRVESESICEGLQLLIRPHPQNIQSSMADLTWLPRLEKLNDLDRVAVDIPSLVKSKMNWSMQHSDMIRLANWLHGSSIVINSGSTISIEAILHDKPVILTSFDGHDKISYWKSARRLIDYGHLKKLLDMNCVDIANSYSSLLELIKANLIHPNKNQSYRKASLKAECLTEGNSTGTIVDLLNR